MLAAALMASVALGIVIPDTPITPWRDVVGKWAGASGAAIGPNWVITARHNSHDFAYFDFKMHDVSYDVIAVYPHESADFMLLEINPATPLPTWACIGKRVEEGINHAFYTQIGGYGRQAGSFFVGDPLDGYCWGQSGKAWGENDVFRVGTFLYSVFDESTNYAGEGAAAAGDSGGPLVGQQQGQPVVLGIWVGTDLNCEQCIPSGCNVGSAWYSLQSYALALSEPQYKRWIMKRLQPGDANLDGATDFRDLVIVLQQWLQQGATLSGDVNMDGVVNFTDYNIVSCNFNTALDCTP
jgi:hypothetical protein